MQIHAKIEAAVLLLVCLVMCASCGQKASEKPWINTEDEYNAALKELDERQISIFRQRLPDKEENRLFRELGEESLQLAVKHAATSPTALADVTDNCARIPREQVREVYNALNTGMKKTNLGKSFKAYIDTKGVLVGDSLPHFNGVSVDGKPFDWSVTDGKRILLIYEGWGYLKRSTHFWFKDLLAATDRDSLAVVAYVYASSPAELQQRVKAFQLEPYLVISDLKGKEGPLDRKMGIHGIPTYYYTDRNGIVRRVMSGFQEELFTYYTGLSPEWGENWTEEKE